MRLKSSFNVGRTFQHYSVRRIHQIETDENRHPFAETLVQGRLTASQGRIVHAREIVKDEGAVVDELNRRRRRQHLSSTTTDELRTKKRQQRTNAFASGKDRGVERVVEAAVRIRPTLEKVLP